MIRALERQEATEGIDDKDDELAPLQKSKTAPTAPSEPSEAGSHGTGISRAFTGTTLVDPSMAVSPESTPSMSSEDTLELAAASPATPKHKREWVPTSNGKARQGSLDRDLKTFSSNPMTFGELNSDTATKPLRSRRLLSSGGEMTTAKEDEPQNVGDVVAYAMKTLSLIRQKEQSARPLRVVRQDPQHAPDDALRKRFQDLVNDELQIRRLNARDWLRVATWWLLKVSTMPPSRRRTLNWLNRRNTTCGWKSRSYLTIVLASASLVVQNRRPTKLILIC